MKSRYVWAIALLALLGVAIGIGALRQETVAASVQEGDGRLETLPLGDKHVGFIQFVGGVGASVGVQAVDVRDGEGLYLLTPGGDGRVQEQRIEGLDLAEYHPQYTFAEKDKAGRIWLAARSEFGYIDSAARFHQVRLPKTAHAYAEDPNASDAPILSMVLDVNDSVLITRGGSRGVLEYDHGRGEFNEYGAPPAVGVPGRLRRLGRSILVSEMLPKQKGDMPSNHLLTEDRSWKPLSLKGEAVPGDDAAVVLRPAGRGESGLQYLEANGDVRPFGATSVELPEHVLASSASGDLWYFEDQDTLVCRNVRNGARKSYRLPRSAEANKGVSIAFGDDAASIRPAAPVPDSVRLTTDGDLWFSYSNGYSKMLVARR